MKHILRLAGEQGPADMPAAILALFSTRGEDTAAANAMLWRAKLADAVGPGDLADVLVLHPGRIAVAWVPDPDGTGGQYEIEAR
ncbi:MAG TPA: hypothetical protein VH092_37815 [Urbifossiella sp.]|nr:hypothetical protein [Urbifossiella sp.]